MVPAAGRLFGAGDSEAPGASPVAVVSHRFWTRRFNADPAVVGRAVRIDARPYTIVGVAPEGFQGTGVRATDVWLPITEDLSHLSRGDRRYGVLARLKPGVTPAHAQAELNALTERTQRQFPESDAGVGAVVLLAAGGLLYSAGAVVYALRRPDPRPKVFGYHEIFHVLVIAAAAAHYAAIAGYALPAHA